MKSCTALAVQADGLQISTIEGIPADAPLKRAFHENHALQCGFCTPGMIMAATALLADTPDPSEHQIRAGLKGNLCRCTGYHNIVEAVRMAAEEMRA